MISKVGLDWWRLSLLFILSVLCYWKILDNYIFLDDANAIFAGYLLSHDITKIFTYNFWAIYMSPLRRVVVALSYIPNYLISGTEPWSYYLVNIALHFGVSALAYKIVKKLSGNENLGLLTAILFSVSLNKADSVMMIAHRTTLMGAFFALLSLHLYLRIFLDGYNRKVFLYTLLSYIAALGSYETALVMPLFFVTAGLLWNRDTFLKKEIIFINIIFMSITITLILFLQIGTGTAISETSFVGKVYHIIRNIFSVLPTFIVPPFVFKSDVVYHSETIYFGWSELAGLIMAVAIILINLKLKERLIYFGLLFFFVSSIATATVRWSYYPEIPFYRLRFSIGKYSYLSSFGFYIVLGSLLYICYEHATAFKSKAVHVIASAALVVFILFNIFWIYEREKIWDDATLNWKVTAKRIISLNLNMNDYSGVYLGDPLAVSQGTHEDKGSYAHHMESLLRVMYNNPDLPFRSITDYNGAKSSKGKVLLLFYAGKSRLSAFEVANENNRGFITRQIR